MSVKAVKAVSWAVVCPKGKLIVEIDEGVMVVTKQGLLRVNVKVSVRVIVGSSLILTVSCTEWSPTFARAFEAL